MVTVVFADLVGFTSLSETLDPERVKRLVDGAFEQLVHDVHAFGGRVDKIRGDAIVALFGAPVAHEDDAERAVRAALRMQESLASYSADTGVVMRMRVGVNTGEVLVGALRSGGDYTAMGDVVNTASRLQTSAEPGEVVVGESTYGPTRTAISYTRRGALVVRGREHPVEAFVAGEALVAPGYRSRRATPLVGRDAELTLLDNTVSLSIGHRRGQVILLLGEAGMGKTRLANELAQAVRRIDPSATVLSGRCVPYGEANPWWPVAEAVREACGIETDDPLDTARNLCGDAVAKIGLEGAESVVIVNGLLHVMGYETPLRALDPSRARTEANQALLSFMEAGVRRRPVVIQLADLHWADDEVLELIETMSEQLARLPFVLVATARRALTARWSPRAGRHNVVVLNLDALDRESAASLLDGLVPADVPFETRQTLLDRSGGNPFYLEELARVVTDRGGLSTDAAAALPDTLRGLIAARVDALTPDEQATVEEAAVWGASGSLFAIGQIARQTRGVEDLRPVVESLVAKDILVLDEEEWSFRSDIVREIAYSRLTKLDRFHRHLGIAQYLDEAAGGRFVDDGFVEMLARHFGEAAALIEDAGRPDRYIEVPRRALVWLAEATRRADASASWVLADRLSSQALDIAALDIAALDIEVPDIAPSHGNDDGGARSADVRIGFLLSRAHARAELWRLADARADAEAAGAMASERADPAAEARVDLTRGEIATRDGRHDEAVEILNRALEHYDEVCEQAGRAQALRLLGMAELFRNDFAAAEAPIAASLEAFRSVDDRRGEAWALQNLAWIAFIAGRIDEADARLDESGRAFLEIGDRGGIAWATGLSAFVRMYQGRFDEARRLAESMLAEGERRSDLWGQAMMLIVLSAVDLWQGHTLQAVRSAERAVLILRGLGEAVGLEQALAVCGRATVMSGDVASGLELLDEAVRIRGTSELREGVAVLGRLAVLVQLGTVDSVDLGQDPSEPKLADGPVAALGFDQRVAVALATAQRGRIDEAMSIIDETLVLMADSGYGRAVRALVASASTRPVAAVPPGVSALDGSVVRSTYLDEIYELVATGLNRGVEWSDTFARAEERAAATGDVLAMAMVLLARATVSEACGSEDADAVRAEAEARWAVLGVDPTGWRRLFAAACAVPA